MFVDHWLSWIHTGQWILLDFVGTTNGRCKTSMSLEKKLLSMVNIWIRFGFNISRLSDRERKFFRRKWLWGRIIILLLIKEYAGMKRILWLKFHVWHVQKYMQVGWQSHYHMLDENVKMDKRESYEYKKLAKAMDHQTPTKVCFTTPCRSGNWLVFYTKGGSVCTFPCCKADVLPESSEVT